MAFARRIWGGSYAVEKLPKFPCPLCDSGHLKAVEDGLDVVETGPSKSYRKHDDWDPDWIVERFSLTLQCDEGECGEISKVIGETELVEYNEEVDGEYERGYAQLLKIKGMYPAPPIIPVPENTPLEFDRYLEAAFSLFWVDFRASAGMLRASLEVLLDHLQVPRVSVNKNGETSELNLNGRIQNLEKNHKDESKTLHALRMVGNLGAHGADVKREALLDAFEIYEHALAELVDKRTEKLNALREKILVSKGKY